VGFAYPGIGPPTKVLWWGLAKGFVNAPRPAAAARARGRGPPLYVPHSGELMA